MTESERRAENLRRIAANEQFAAECRRLVFEFGFAAVEHRLDNVLGSTLPFIKAMRRGSIPESDFRIRAEDLAILLNLSVIGIESIRPEEDL